MYCSVSYLPLHRTYSTEAQGVSSVSGSSQAPQLERFVSRDQSSRDGFGMRDTAKKDMREILAKLALEPGHGQKPQSPYRILAP